MPDPEYLKKHGKGPKKRPRIESLKETNSRLSELPVVDVGGHIIDWLHGIGITEHGDTGSVKPLSWREINAWKQANDVAATREELELMHYLSRVYVGQYHRSENPEEPAPNRPVSRDKSALKGQIKSALRASAERNKD